MNDFLAGSPLRYLIPGALLMGLLVLGYWVLSEFLYSLAWSLIIAYSTWPVYYRLRQRLKGNATISALLMTTVIALLIFIAVFGLAALLQDELKFAYQAVVVELLQEPYELPDFIKNIPWLGHSLQEWQVRLADDRAAVAGQLANWAKQWLGYLGSFLGSVGHYIMKLAVVTVTVFFCFRDGERIVEQVHTGLIQFLGKHQDIYFQSVTKTTSAVVNGLVLTALAQGFLAGFGFYMADVKAPVLFGAITALLALVPMVGAALIWLPIGLILILMDRVGDGIGVLLWGGLIVSTIDNVVRPLIISGTGQVPFLVVLFGVLGGLSAFGMVGLFMGPVILAVLLAVWEAWLEQQSGENVAGGS
ncbi:MAG: AI-2E family transporter [Methylobacter sp.]|nr:AI-2E family transporter [Methylobacter sp.]MDP2098952.1 AI-2E family transporter [Methylobacter sp.]MDP2427497.1 AI-2E family transporter [Methylobacter sp.]MDP3056782.1 AI-2E family transporter [Methylobacter sp.]MDP3364199.1 AI-2E family transporter [Methylobacter sp.]